MKLAATFAKSYSSHIAWTQETMAMLGGPAEYCEQVSAMQLTAEADEETQRRGAEWCPGAAVVCNEYK